MICKVADLVPSETEVAVTVAVNALATEAGALNVAAEVVWPVSVPPPETVHVTPPFFESLETVAVSATVCA